MFIAERWSSFIEFRRNDMLLKVKKINIPFLRNSINISVENRSNKERGWKACQQRARLSEPGFSGLVDFQDWEVEVSMFLLKVDGYFWIGMLLPSPVGTQCL